MMDHVSYEIIQETQTVNSGDNLHTKIQKAASIAKFVCHSTEHEIFARILVNV
jgi:hypothetical protein